jgi:hypothetical protein
MSIIDRTPIITHIGIKYLMFILWSLFTVAIAPPITNRTK